MPESNAQSRFLLRGSSLLIGLLILWWFVLQNPMAAVLQRTAQGVGAVLLGVPASKMIVEAGNGDWTFEVPIEFDSAPDASNGLAKHYRSINFDMSRSDVNAFTFSVPVFLAIVLAAPWSTRSLGVLVKGTVLLALMEIALLLLFAEVFAHKTAGRMALSTSAFQSWVFHLGEYMVLNVVPYIAPFVIALWLHLDLRSMVFGWLPADAAAVAVPKEAVRPKRRIARARAG